MGVVFVIVIVIVVFFVFVFSNDFLIAIVIGDRNKTKTFRIVRFLSQKLFG